MPRKKRLKSPLLAALVAFAEAEQFSKGRAKLEDHARRELVARVPGRQLAQPWYREQRAAQLSGHIGQPESAPLPVIQESELFPFI